MKIKPFERGQALIIIALALVGLIGIAGLVIDGGNAFQDRQRAQNAVDAAALASAHARVTGGNVVDAAMASAAKNGYNNDGVQNIISLYTPPKDGPHAGDLEYIQVIIRSTVTTYLMRVIGTDEIVNGHAVISLAPNSSCLNRSPFWIHGEATLDISGGGVFVNAGDDCALVQQGSGSIRIAGDYDINVVGTANVQKVHLFTPAISPGAHAQAIPYPPPFFMPNVKGCGGDAEIREDGITMSPGAWGDDFPPPGVTLLESGVYCLNNGMHITGNLEGHNVLFFVRRGEVRFNSGADILLDAPNTGDNAGLLIYLPMENRSKVVLNGGAGSNIQGTILAPASPVLIKGMDSKTGFHSQIIGYTIEADGTSNVVIRFIPEQNYQTLTMPEIQLAQ